MTERSSGGNNLQEDPRQKFRISRAQTAAFVGGISAFLGGVSYGASRLAFDEDVANRVGIGIGLGIGGIGGGLMISIESQNEAERLAIAGEVEKAIKKVRRCSIEAAAGFGTSGAVAGWEGAGIPGAIVGGAIGAFIGAKGMADINKDMRELGVAYRDVIIPSMDPKNFPEYSVTRDSRFKDEEPNSYSPPVYQAASIGDLKGFRQAQVNDVATKCPTLNGKFRIPEIVLGRMDSAVFLVPKVTHYPAFDPKSRRVFFEKLEEPSEAVQLNTEDDKLIANPYKEPTSIIWPYTTEFIATGLFNDEQWQYWREISWNKGVVLLAKREFLGREQNSEIIKPIVEDKYYLIDILLDDSERGRKIRRKVPKEVQEPIPSWNPQPKSYFHFEPKKFPLRLD